MLFNYHPGDEFAAIVAALCVLLVGVVLPRYVKGHKRRAAWSAVLAIIVFLVAYHLAQVWS